MPKGKSWLRIFRIVKMILDQLDDTGLLEKTNDQQVASHVANTINLNHMIALRKNTAAGHDLNDPSGGPGDWAA